MNNAKSNGVKWDWNELSQMYKDNPYYWLYRIWEETGNGMSGASPTDNSSWKFHCGRQRMMLAPIGSFYVHQSVNYFSSDIINSCWQEWERKCPVENTPCN
ncbi:MAG: hypothetical protein JEZ07_17675 [Phycisphaerae bacterium]|nr:hypothetical protein [Phycisphaerae bacterium]